MSLAFAAGRSPKPTIFFLTPDHPEPSGGIRVIYRHVDILNDCGMSAVVLHRQAGFRCTWFENETRVTDVAAAEIRRGDILVVPEVDVGALDGVPPGIRRVIFNQNSHLTWKRASDRVARFYAADPDLAAVICVSEHNRQMLSRTFPGCLVHRVHLGIDSRMFGAGLVSRPRRIAYMPRRGGEDAHQVLSILQARGVLDGWEVVALDGLTHCEVAAALQMTRIFLAFTRQEGFGLPAAEAMACGCYVIGNHGFGGKEFFLPEFSVAVEAGDILGFVSKIEAALQRERRDAQWCSNRGREASEFIHAEYSTERERRDVSTIYARLLGDLAVVHSPAAASAS